MAQQDKQQAQSAFGAWFQLLVAGILSASAILLPPLTSMRPPPDGAGNDSTGIQDVDARLWQDPFEAAVKADKDKDKEYWECLKHRNELKTDAEKKKQTCTSNDYRDLTWLTGISKTLKVGKIIYALVPGDNAVGNEESRRRQRYALLAGLSVSGYAPDDPEHVGYVKQKILGKELIIPYEVLNASEPEKKPLPKTLLLWVDEEALIQAVANKEKDQPCDGGDEARCREVPLARLSELIQGIKDVTKDQAIIGPSTSTFLVAATAEICTNETKKINPEIQDDSYIKSLRKVPWYSPNATLPKTSLEFSCKPSFAGKPIRYWDDAMDFKRLVPSDDEVLDALTQELKERHVLKEGNAIALVGEWDTGYSRSLIRIFGTEQCQTGRDRMLCASYLRGLDGKRPGARAEKEAVRKDGDADKHDRERPEGDAQQDYLRRLGDQLKARAKSEGRHVAAVGILGNDYHDKRLVIEELRSKFPQAVFFTTDLDAAMLHPKDNKVMRNLVVAAGYGLELSPELQKGIPPFRQTYQTATFLAAQMAGDPSRFRDHMEENWWLRPKIFEIGRREAVPLPAALEDKPAGIAGPAHPFGGCAPHVCDPLQPAWITVLYAPGSLFFALLVSAGCGLVRRGWVCWWSRAIGLTMIASVVVVGSQHVGVIEPFDWWQGISIWPSELVRILAIGLSIAFILHGRFLIADKNARLNEHYQFDLPGKGKNGNDADGVHHDSVTGCWSGGCWEHATEGKGCRAERQALPLPRESASSKVRQAWKEIRDMSCMLFCQGNSLPDDQDGKKERDIIELFSRYVHPCSVSAQQPRAPWFLRWPTCQRAILFCALYFLGSIVILQWILGLERPSVPARGDFAFGVDMAILLAMAGFFLLLCFYALDRVSRAIWLARELDAESHHCTNWPTGVLNVFRVSTSGSRKFIPFDKLRIYYSDWLDAHFIAQVTEPVQKIIFYPFVILSLMIIARSRLFDGWHYSPMLVIGFSAICLLLVIATFRLRMMAEKVREQAVRRLNRHLVNVRGQGAPYSDKLAGQIEVMLSQVRELRVGAFAPVSQQPLFQAAMTVVSSLSGMQLLDHFGAALI
ncbi:MAG: hypothetical protein KGZ83_02655 [Sulfuricella sp.]|nr:hypothetical protein [Sulfuricella sp.]